MKEILKKQKNVEAIEITQYPDYLLKSQIAQYEGNQAAALKNRNAYFAMLEKIIIMEQCIINTTL
jgi:hypothetical protein